MIAEFLQETVRLLGHPGRNAATGTGETPVPPARWVTEQGYKPVFLHEGFLGGRACV